MANTITGKIKTIEPIIAIQGRDGQSTFYKRYMVLDCTRYDPRTGERSARENTPQIEFFGGDICQRLEEFHAGQLVTVSFDLEGHSYVSRTTGKAGIITTVRGYAIEAIYQQAHPQQAAPAQPQGPAVIYPTAPAPAPAPPAEFANDLPF